MNSVTTYNFNSIHEPSGPGQGSPQGALVAGLARSGEPFPQIGASSKFLKPCLHLQRRFSDASRPQTFNEEAMFIGFHEIQWPSVLIWTSSILTGDLAEMPCGNIAGIWMKEPA